MKLILVSCFCAYLYGCSLHPYKKNIEMCLSKSNVVSAKKTSFESNLDLKNIDGQFIIIDGTFSYVFENVALYPSDKDNIGQEKALWMNIILFDGFTEAKLLELNNKKITVIGKINSSYKGHMNSFKGSIDSIICIKEIE